MLYVFDYETTGIDPTIDRPVEVAVINEKAEVIINEYCDPQRPIPPQAAEVHGITEEKLVGCNTYEEVLTKQHKLMKAGTIWAGYNIQTYDCVMFECCTQAPFNVDIIDVYSIVLRKFPLKESKKLTAIYFEAFGKDFEGAHGALADCTATLELLDAFKEYLGMTYKEMAEWLTIPQPYTRIPFGRYKGASLDQVPLSWVNWVENNWKVISPDMKATLEEIKKCR
jgi:DNA polymerase III epsilon subunit-like protein